MAELYPTNMPLPMITGYTQGSANQVEQVDVEIGAPRFEFKVDTVNMPVKVRWLFDDIQMQVFEGWYFHVLDSGTKSFDMDLIVGGGAKSHECYFQKPYKIALKNKKWLVTGDLNAVSKQYDSLAVYQAARDQLIGVVLSAFELAIIADNPEYWYRLNEASGTTTIDSGSANHNLTYQADVSTGGQDVTASSIHTGTGTRAKNTDAVGEGSKGAQGLSGQLATSFTIEFVVNFTTGNSTIISYTDATGSGFPDVSAGTDNQFRIQFLDTGTQTLFFGIFDNSGVETTFDIIPDYNAYNGSWVYISITFDSNTNTLITKVNDVTETTIDTSPETIRAPTLTNGQLCLMVYPDGQGTSKNGVSLDEVQIYDRILSSVEQTEHYNLWSTGVNP